MTQLNLDKNTFGDSKASIFLVEELNRLNDIKLSKKLSRFITHFNCVIKDIDLKNEKKKDFILFLIRKFYFDKIDNPEKMEFKLPELIKNLLKNYINYRIKTL
jgi:hypothetical protein